eukprot:3619113-Amphidinium_carterae.1
MRRLAKLGSGDAVVALLHVRENLSSVCGNHHLFNVLGLASVQCGLCHKLCGAPFCNSPLLNWLRALASVAAEAKL